MKSESYDMVVGENAYLKQRLETVIKGKCSVYSSIYLN